MVRFMAQHTSSSQLSGAVVQALRLEQGWSHRDLTRESRAFGKPIGHTTFWKIEAKGQRPRPRTEAVIARIFGLTVSQLRRLTVEDVERCTEERLRRRACT